MRKRITAILLLVILPTVVLAAAVRSFEHTNGRGQFLAQRLDRFLITGEVVDENRQPVSGANVAAHPDSLHGKLPMATTDNQGRFSIPVYKTGTWTITANKPARGYPMMSPFYYPLVESIANVKVKEDEQAPFVKVKLSRAAKLNVRIADQETGQPIRNAQIGLCRIEAPRFCHRQNLAVRNGQFEVLVPFAPISVQISAAGYEDWYIRDNNDSAPKPLLASSSETPELNVFLKRGDSRAGSLDAPHPYSPPDGTEFFHYPRITRLEWLAVPAAATYTVEVDFCLGGYPAQKECKDPRPLMGLKIPPMAGIQGTSYEFSFLGNQPGRWRVWAVDALGRPGRKSHWTMFFYRL
jgi:hypothetical protein